MYNRGLRRQELVRVNVCVLANTYDNICVCVKKHTCMHKKTCMHAYKHTHKTYATADRNEITTKLMRARA